MSSMGLYFFFVCVNIIFTGVCLSLFCLVGRGFYKLLWGSECWWDGGA